MTEKPQVIVTDVSNTDRAEVIGKLQDLGDFATSMRVSKVLLRLRKTAKTVLHLKWEGSKIPRGAVINGSEIAWTQHGLVTGADGKHLGTYCRIVEFGGKSGNEHQMLIAIS